MRVKFVSGPNAGQARHCERNWIVDLLIDAGILEHAPQLVDSTPPVPVRPDWGLAHNTYGEVIGLCIKFDREIIIVSGAAEGMVERCKRALAGRPADLPTNDLINLYVATAKPSALTPVPRYDGSRQ